LGVEVPALLPGAILVLGFGDAAGVAAAGFDTLDFAASAVDPVIYCYSYILRCPRNKECKGKSSIQSIRR
jgi:hypothetical protein